MQQERERELRHHMERKKVNQRVDTTQSSFFFIKNNTEVVCQWSSGPHFVRILHHDPSVLGGPTRHGS